MCLVFLTDTVSLLDFQIGLEWFRSYN